MLNHKLPMQTRWRFDQERDGFVLKALEDIPKGAEVSTSYGSSTHNNWNLFFGYGFVLEEQSNLDMVALEVKIDEEDPEYKSKLNHLTAATYG